MVRDVIHSTCKLEVTFKAMSLAMCVHRTLGTDGSSGQLQSGCERRPMVPIPGCSLLFETFTSSDFSDNSPKGLLLLYQLFLPSLFFLFSSFFFLICLFIWLHQVLTVVRGFFSGSMQGLVPWPGIKPEASALGAWSLSHWTIREIPLFSSFNRRHMLEGPGLMSP